MAELVWELFGLMILGGLLLLAYCLGADSEQLGLMQVVSKL